MLFLSTSFLFQIFHVRLSVSHHREQSSTRVVVLRIFLQMEGELFDALTKYGNLNSRRARILVVDLGFFDNFGFFGLGNHQITIAYKPFLIK